MIVSKTNVFVTGIQGYQITDFMLNCSDKRYQAWWPGTHLAFHTLKRCPGEVGSLVYFDEYVGHRRLTFQAKVVEYHPGSRLAWRLRWLVALPAWIILDIKDQSQGVTICHSLKIGYKRLGRLLDPILRLYFPQKFQEDLEEHARSEFRMLATRLEEIK